MWTCNRCDAQNQDKNNFCIECGVAKPKFSDNYCSNPNCKFHNILLPSMQKYCGQCGSATTYWEETDNFLHGK